MRFQLATLDRACQTIVNDKLAQEFFAKSLAVRFKGYRPYFLKNSLPADMTDFIGTHLLVCYDGVVVSTLKFVLWDVCQEYGIEFPMFEWLNTPKNKKIYNRFTKYIEEHKHSKIAYAGSFTIDPEFSQHSEMIKKYMAVAYLRYLETNRIDVSFCVGVKSAQPFIDNMLGHKRFVDDNAYVDAFDVEVTVNIWTEQPRTLQEMPANILSAWDDRLDFSVDKSVKKAA